MTPSRVAPSPVSSATARPEDRPDWLRIGLRVAVVSALIGVFVSLLNPTWEGVGWNVLYSDCIGLSIFLVYRVIGLMNPRAHALTFRDHLIRAAIATPIGFVAGVNVGALFSGRPLGLGAFAVMAPFSVVVTIVASVGFTYVLWSRHRMAEQAAANADALRTAAEARLKLLQTQIEPHMLFNTLANLRTLVDVDPARAQTMIDELIVYLRATLAASRNPTATLAEECEQLRAYLELMVVRMAHRLRYAIDLPDALRDAQVPPMLLQPLVENAIKHGLEPKIAGGTIRVSVTGSDARLAIEVRDDGVGLGDAPVAPGYGLTHVRERLATLYGADAHLAIAAAEGGGVVVRLELPR